MASSDFSSTYMLGVRLVAFPSRPGTRGRAWMRPPRFRAKNFSTCTRSPTARGSSHASHSPWDDVAFSSTERDRHLGIRPVSQLNTWPVVSPVNASRRPSRDAAHHSGSGRLARPSPWGTLTSYSLPAFLAHSELGQTRKCPCLRGTSVVPSRADVVRPPRHVRFVLPNSDIPSSLIRAIFVAAGRLDLRC